MFNLVETGQVRVPLWDASKPVPSEMTNQLFLREHVMALLTNAFPHLAMYVLPPSSAHQLNDLTCATLITPTENR